jgi:hypothetical protein
MTDENIENIEPLVENEENLIFSDEAYRQYLKFLALVADKLIRENDIRERTQIDENEVAVFAMLKALIQNRDMKEKLPSFTAFLERFCDEYLHLSISRKRKSRAEIIETVRSAFRAVEEKAKKGFMEKLLRG